MFEKFSSLDIDSAGRGGEYTVQVIQPDSSWNLLAHNSFVQAGFGWTNGVVLWVASIYGSLLATPECPALLVNTTQGGVSASNSVAGLTSNPKTIVLLLVFASLLTL